EQFIPASHFAQQWITPASEPLFAAALARGAAGVLVFPQGLAGLLVEAMQHGVLTGPEVQEYTVSRDHGRAAVPPDMLLLAEVRPLPQLLPIQVVAEHTGTAEEDDHTLAVRGGRSRTERVRRMGKL